MHLPYQRFKLGSFFRDTPLDKSPLKRRQVSVEDGAIPADVSPV
jgi:hypothetical protein